MQVFFCLAFVLMFATLVDERKELKSKGVSMSNKDKQTEELQQLANPDESC